MRLTQIRKLYLSNFLTGLVFWYGIERLFMTTIGIDAVGIGLISAVSSAVILGLEIPGGMLADKWSRKGTLLIATVALALSSVILGLSNGLVMYLLGAILYCVYIVGTNGVYQAIMYDSLHEEGHSKDYSKIMGRAYALFLAGAGVANLASGFIGEAYGFRTTFFLSIIVCSLNFLLLLTVREPAFHKPEHKERLLKQIGASSRELLRIRFLRTLVIIFVVMSIVEIYKLDFGQLYILYYVSSAELLGILWGFYAFMWALGSVIAHRMRTRLSPLVIISTGSLVALALIDHPVSMLLFAVQIVAAAALVNQIETRIQEHTPSKVRASVLSTLSAFGSLIAVPTGLLLGWIIREYNAFRAVQVIAVFCVAALVYWFIERKHMPKLDEPETADANITL